MNSEVNPADASSSGAVSSRLVVVVVTGSPSRERRPRIEQGRRKWRDLSARMPWLTY